MFGQNITNTSDRISESGEGGRDMMITVLRCSVVVVSRHFDLFHLW